MNEIITKPNVLDILARVAAGRPAYRYESRAFLAFMRENGLGFELDTLTAWRDYLIAKGRKARTVNRGLMLGKMLFRDVLERGAEDITAARRREILDALDGIKRLREPRPDIGNRVLTEAEIVTLLDSLEKDRPELSLMIEAMWRTGLRVSELIGLRLDVCKAISKSVIECRILGKGSRERSVWFDVDFFRTVKRYFRPREFLFTRGSKRPRSRSFVSMAIKRAAAKILDRRNLSAHCLRHSFCTHALERGLSLEHVRILAGHADIAVTSKYYAHLQVKAGDVLPIVELNRERHFTIHEYVTRGSTSRSLALRRHHVRQ